MSPAKKDRKNQSEVGINVRSYDGSLRMGAAGFAAAIADALHREFDGNGSAIKTIVGLTAANERAVKNWYQGRNGPSGEFLILLCRHSDHVLEDRLSPSLRRIPHLDVAARRRCVAEGSGSRAEIASWPIAG
jgi:hypothetical protein